MKKLAIVLSLTVLAPWAQGQEKAAPQAQPQVQALTQAGHPIASDLTPLVQGEYGKTQASFQGELNTLRKKINDLHNERKKVISTSHSVAKSLESGAALMKRYDILLTGRYVDRTGAHQPGMELSSEDVENINRLFRNYLQMTPLIGRVSVGQAHQSLEWGMKRMEDVAKRFAEPSEGNNSDLEIIAYRLRESEHSVQKTAELAEKLGLKVVIDPAVTTRAPASE